MTTGPRGSVPRHIPPNTPTLAEMQCIELLAELGTIAAVAKHLEIAEQTVKNRLADLRRKISGTPITNLQVYAKLAKGVTFSAMYTVSIKREP